MTARSLFCRLFWTLSLPLLLLWISDKLLLPGVDAGFVTRMQNRAPWLDFGASRSVGVFALGIMPILSAYGVVEFIALGVPRLNRMRYGNPKGRAKLELAARALGLVLAAFQAFELHCAWIW